MAEVMNVMASGKGDQCRGTSKWLRKTKLCANFMQGGCARGASCSFAHSGTELQSAPDLLKTKLCKKYEEGECKDPQCPFAHGEEELRLPPNFKRKMCKWFKQGKCRNGERCEFAHGIEELRAAQAADSNSQVEPSETETASPQSLANIPAPPGLSQPLALTSLVQPPILETSIKQETLASVEMKSMETAELKQQVQQMSMQIGLMSQQMDGLVAQLQVNQMRQELEKLTAQCAVLESVAQYPPAQDLEAFQQQFAQQRTSLRTPLKKNAQVFVPNYSAQWSACDWTLNGNKHWDGEWASDDYCDDSTSVGSSGTD